MTAAFALRGPGLHWLPQPIRTRGYWGLVTRFALIGPFVGGLPYIWMIVSLPFMFVIGLVPAFIAGMLYAAWWLTPGSRHPTPIWRGTVGAICGAAGCALVAAGYSPGSPGWAFLILAAHGVPAAGILALVTGTKKRASGRARLASTNRSGLRMYTDLDPGRNERTARVGDDPDCGVTDLAVATPGRWR